MARSQILSSPNNKHTFRDCVKTNVLSHGVLADPIFSQKQIYILRSFEVCRPEVQHFSFLLSFLSVACLLPCTWRFSSQHLLLKYLMKMAQDTLQAKEAESSITEEMLHDLKNQRSL